MQIVRSIRALIVHLTITFLALAVMIQGINPCIASDSGRDHTWSITVAAPTANHVLKRLSGVAIQRWTFPGNIHFKKASVPAQLLSSIDLVELTQISPLIVNPAPWQLVLRNGDLLPGKPVSTIGQYVIFDAAGLGLVHIPIGKIAGLRLSSKVAIHNLIADHDTIYFKNNDHLIGVVIAIKRNAIIFQSSLGNSVIPLARIDHVILGGTYNQASSGTLRAKILLKNGLSITTTHFVWKSSKISLSDPAGKTIFIADNTLAGIEIIGGKAIWLSDIPPTQVHQVSWIGDDWPMQINRCVTGGPLKVDGSTYRRGIGVHVNCSLEFTLAEKYGMLIVRPAMDDSASPLGCCNLTILADGKVIYSATGIKPAAPAPLVRLSIKGVKILELKADDAGRYGIRGRVDWLAPVLISK